MKTDKYYSIDTIQKGLIDHHYTAIDLVDSYYARIKKSDVKINALLTLSEEIAYKKARWTDNLIKNEKEKALEKYPLLGVCIVHKDMFSTKGVRTTAASKLLEYYIPEYSATIVNKLDMSGCIMLGKANCDAWAHGSSGENSDYGPTKNPWNVKYVAGGSSSGSAASIASNFCLASTGTDTCGSIRIPSNFCGVVGLKPTYGRVSRYGLIAMASSLDSVGPMARSAEDSKKIFEIMVGADNRDATLKDKLLEKKAFKKKLKIGIPKEFFSEGLGKDVTDCLKDSINVFKKLGYEIKDVNLPHTKEGISVYYIIQPAEVSSNLGRFDGIRFGKNRETFGDEAKRRIMLGTYVLSAGYYDAFYNQAMKVRSIIINEVADVFKDVDALIAPVASTSAFKLGEKTDDPIKMYLTDIYAATANLCGIPAISIPFKFNKQNLPLGFQIMGPKYSENILFSLAYSFEKYISYRPQVVNI